MRVLLRSLACAALLTSSPALAQERPAGAVSAYVFATPEADVGGGVSGDIWYPIEWFRVGGFFGVGAIPSDVDTQNRVFMPLGVSVAAEVVGDVVGVSFRARGGLWGGATQDAKLTVGGLVGLGAHLLVVLGPGVSFTVGMDVFGLFGAGDTVVLAPGLGLTWTPVTSP